MVMTSQSQSAADLAERIAEITSVKGRSLWNEAWRRFMRNRAAFWSVIVLMVIVLFTLIGPFFAAWDNETVDWTLIGASGKAGGPSFANGHYFGVDNSGRDIFARILQAIQISLWVGVVGALVAIVIGTLYGAISGFVGGWVDSVMMRFVEIMTAIPYLFIVIILMVTFSRSFTVLMIGIGATSWMSMARIVRGQTLSLKHREFVEAARATGVNWFTIVVRHITPNLLGVVIIYATLLVPEMVIFESFLSYLGLGVQEPLTSLGKMISEGSHAVEHATSWQLYIPLAFFLLTMMAMFFIGDGLRDALDPKDR